MTRLVRLVLLMSATHYHYSTSSFAAGVRFVTFHGLRHTLASQLYDVTHDMLLVKETSGHIYIATANNHVHRLNNKFLGSTDGLLVGADFLNGNGNAVVLRR